MNVMVTGAGGYIGRHVVEALTRMGHHVIAVDRMPVQGENVTSLDLDIFSGNPDIYDLAGRPDSLIHMAWIDGFVHNSPAHMQYLPMHYRFIEDMLAGGLPQVAVMGTMHEIGYWEGAIAEDTPANPLSLYGIAKNALRQSMTVLQQKFPNAVFQWLRAYYIYGDDGRSHSIFTKLIQAAKEGKKEFPFTSGKNLYDFIHVDDLARQIAACACQQEVTGVINCCSGKPVSLAEQVELFIKDQGLDIKLEYGKFPDRAYDSPGVWGDAQKITQVMNALENKE